MKDIKTSDFEPGQSVYVVENWVLNRFRVGLLTGLNLEDHVVPYRVVSAEEYYVLAKSVTENIGDEHVFCETAQGDCYLISEDNSSLLFLTREAAYDYVKREELICWFIRTVSSGTLYRCSLDQLREIRRIIASEPKSDAYSKRYEEGLIE